MVNCLCTSDAQCHELYYCDAQTQQCLHDQPFIANARAIIAYILIPIVVGISNVGGLGGGIVKTPLLVLMLNYTTKMATMLSYPITLGSCISNIGILLQQRHPLHNRPIVDFSIAIIMVPAILIGTNTGVIMNLILPDLVLNILFVTFLMTVSPYLWKKGMTLLKAERESAKKAITTETPKESAQIESEARAHKDENSVCAEEDQNGALTNPLVKQHTQSALQVAVQYMIEDEHLESNSYFPSRKGSIDTRRQSIFSELRTMSVKQRGMSNAVQRTEIGSLGSRLHIFQQTQEQYQALNVPHVQQPQPQQHHQQQPTGVTNNEQRQLPGSVQEDKESSLCDSFNNSSQDQGQQGNPHWLQLTRILAQEERMAPPLKVSLLFVFLAIMTFFKFEMGSNTLNSIFGIKDCGVMYWVSFALLYVILLSCSYVSYKYVQREIGIKEQCMYPFDEFDIRPLTIRKYIQLTISGFMAGFMAGMLGAGAGLVIVPALLLLNVHPRVAAATSGTMYFFISATSILTTITQGTLSATILGWYTVLGFIGGLVFSNIVYYLVRKYNRNSVPVFIVFAVAILNLVSCFLYVAKQAADDCYSWQKLLAVGQFCD